MTSKKRVDIGPGEGEVEPKRPRGGDDDAAETSEGAHLATATERVGESSASAARRGHHRDYLKYSGGRREPRIGDDFQVSILPSPGDATSNKDDEAATAAAGTGQDKSETKEDS